MTGKCDHPEGDVTIYIILAWIVLRSSIWIITRKENFFENPTFIVSSFEFHEFAIRFRPPRWVVCLFKSRLLKCFCYSWRRLPPSLDFSNPLPRLLKCFLLSDRYKSHFIKSSYNLLLCHNFLALHTYYNCNLQAWNLNYVFSLLYASSSYQSRCHVT